LFASDQLFSGMMLGRHGLAGKWAPWEESIRVPLIIRDPRMPRRKRGTVDDTSFTLNIDLAETILGAAGLPPSPYMQGRDMADLYLTSPTNSSPWREDFYYEFPIDHPMSTALITKEWKYIRYDGRNTRVNGKQREQLFNLKEDPYELNDLIESDHVQETILPMLKERYEKVRADATVPIPMHDCVKIKTDADDPWNPKNYLP
jgi:arylsulfatase A-like enzyme